MYIYIYKYINCVLIKGLGLIYAFYSLFLIKVYLRNFVDTLRDGKQQRQQKQKRKRNNRKNIYFECFLNTHKYMCLYVYI
jgi:hypothetical protein